VVAKVAYLFVRDRDERGHLDLARFLAHIGDVLLQAVSASDRHWRVKYIAHAAGRDVYPLELRNEAEGNFDMVPDELVRLVGIQDQFIGDLHVVEDSTGLEFGLFDSTFLFVRGPQSLCEAVIEPFEEVELGHGPIESPW